MRIEAIRNSTNAYCTPKLVRRVCYNSSNVLRHDTVAFKQGNTVKGAGIGAALGLLAIGALSAISGGVATPALYGLYAAAFGTAGGIAGRALDEKEAANTKQIGIG